jgi:hypothetical protein
MFPACVLLKCCWQLIIRGLHQGCFCVVNSLQRCMCHTSQEDGPQVDCFVAVINEAADITIGDGLSGYGDKAVYLMDIKSL